MWTKCYAHPGPAALVARGVLIPPSPLEAWFVSAAHGTREIDETVAAARAAFVAMTRVL